MWRNEHGSAWKRMEGEQFHNVNGRSYIPNGSRGRSFRGRFTNHQNDGGDPISQIEAHIESQDPIAAMAARVAGQLTPAGADHLQNIVERAKSSEDPIGTIEQAMQHVHKHHRHHHREE